jgi:7-cyano-7-deazaguanine synthase
MHKKRGICLQENASPKVVLLSSGGVDSTALLDFYLKRRDLVECLHIQYGQANAISEKRSFGKILEHYAVKGRIIDLGFTPINEEYKINCRNALFVVVAASVAKHPARLAIGVHVGSRYYDCSELFIKDCQRMLDGYFSGTVRLEAPFLEFSKYQIINYCKTNKVPTKLTYSCLKQNFPPCGQCPACLDNQKLVEE